MEREENAESLRNVAAARAGDEASFARLYEDVAPALYAWADLRLHAGTRLHVEPADLVQEVWLRAWRAISSFDPEDVPFRPWVFRVAKNVLLEAIRATQRAGAHPGLAGPSTKLFALENVPDAATAISRRMARDEDLARFAEHVRSLDEEERQLVLLCGLEGLSRREAAARLELGEEALTKRWQRLRGRLRERGVGAGVLAG